MFKSGRAPRPIHAENESAGPNISWGKAVAPLGRPHCQTCFCGGTCGFILSVGVHMNPGGVMKYEEALRMLCADELRTADDMYDNPAERRHNAAVIVGHKCCFVVTVQV